VTPAPNGHIVVANEYQATGGRDIESDQTFRIRIKNGSTFTSRGTLDYIAQALLVFNEDILKVYNSGVNDQNQHIISIATQNGIDFTDNELSQLLVDITPYLSLGEYNGTVNASVNVVLQNIQYQYIDLDFRVELVQTASVDEVRRDIQTAMTKYIDPRFWKPGQRVEWDNLLQIVKDAPQVKYVNDSFFTPNIDTVVDPAKLPRIRGFIMRDLQGNLIQDTGAVISDVFYPTDEDIAFQTTIVK